MAATNEYLKRTEKYNVTHTKLLFITVSPYGLSHKETITRWVKNTLTQAGVNTTPSLGIISPISESMQGTRSSKMII